MNAIKTTTLATLALLALGAASTTALAGHGRPSIAVGGCVQTRTPDRCDDRRDRRDDRCDDRRDSRHSQRSRWSHAGHHHVVRRCEPVVVHRPVVRCEPVRSGVTIVIGGGGARLAFRD